MDFHEQILRLAEAFKAGRITRRTFLKVSALLLANHATELALVLPLSIGTNLTSFGIAKDFALQQTNDDAKPDYHLTVMRPDDLLLLDFDFYGAERKGNRIERIDKVDYAYMVVNFPPQHIVEEVGLEASEEEVHVLSRQLAPGVFTPLWDEAQQRLLIIRASLSGPSRIAFLFPDAGIDFSLSSLLNWAGLAESVSAVRNTIDEQVIDATVLAPNAVQTALEMPTYITLVPDPGTNVSPVQWLPSNTLTLLNGRAPLWHVKRTIINPGGVADANTPTRLFFASSPFVGKSASILLPTATALTPSDIDSVISQLNGSNNRYLRAENVMLSALGGWLKLRDVSDGKTGEKWIHNMTMGRDQFVRIVNKGFLFPFGHRAERISVSERKFIFQKQGFNGDATTSDAYLLKHELIIVRESERNYEPIASGFRNGGRELPFRSIRILTEVTPLLAPGTIKEQAPFWPMTGQNPQRIEFQLVGIDKNETPISFQMPLVFVPDLPDGFTPSQEDLAQKAIFLYDSGKPEFSGAAAAGGVSTVESADEISMRAQRIAYTYIDPNSTATNSILVTNHMRFSGQMTDATMQGGFLPLIIEAEVRIPELGQITGRTEDVVRVIAYAETYLDHGFPKDLSNNKQQVFAIFTKSAVDFKMPAERSGIATPELNFTGLSRLVGPVPFASGAGALPLPTSFLDGNLFGGIKLSQIVSSEDALINFDPESYNKVNDELRKLGSGDEKALSDYFIKQLKTTLDVPGLSVQKPSEKNGPGRITFVLKPKVNEWGPLKKIDGKDITLVLLVTVTTPVDGSNPNYLVDVKLNDFAIEIPSIIQLQFLSFGFTIEKGKGTKVKPSPSGVRFLEGLEFINKLGDLLKDQFKSDENSGNDKTTGLVSFAVKPSLSDIKLAVSLNIPPLGLGVFTLRNLKLTVGLTIPFGPDKVSLLFRVAERNDPFTVAVTIFGGAGFFGMELDFDGKIKLLEAAIEFGGVFAIDLVVAKGVIYAMAGLYFGLQDNDTDKILKFEGFLRCGGKVEVLGIISVSVELYLGFGYKKETRDGKSLAVIFGTARITVEISVLFFHKSVQLDYSIEYVQEGADPTFSDALTIDDWRSYCNAFSLDEEI